MGTRGFVGLIIDGRTKGHYRHFDSYPCAAGAEIVEEIVRADLNAWRDAARSLLLVDEEDEPTPEHVARAKELETTHELVGAHYDNGPNYYQLTRNAQGSIEKHFALGFMLDALDFLADSLFCEYAYIVNLDTDELEFYLGFQNKVHADGRYASSQPNSTEYFPVRLMGTILLSAVRTAPGGKVVELMEWMCRGDDERDAPQPSLAPPDLPQTSRRPDNGIAAMLDLNVWHVPSEAPDFGECRVVEHEYGWVVFISGSLSDKQDEFEEEVPEWLRPAYRRALEHDCILINFDSDGPTVDNLPTWEW